MLTRPIAAKVIASLPVRKRKRRGRNSRKKCPAEDLELRKPKRAKTAYNYFQMHEKARLSECNMQNAAMARYIGNQWKNLSDLERKRFQRMADRDKNRFNKEMNAFRKKLSKSKVYPASVLAEVHQVQSVPVKVHSWHPVNQPCVRSRLASTPTFSKPDIVDTCDSTSSSPELNLRTIAPQELPHLLDRKVQIIAHSDSSSEETQPAIMSGSESLITAPPSPALHVIEDPQLEKKDKVVDSFFDENWMDIYSSESKHLVSKRMKDASAPIREKEGGGRTNAGDACLDWNELPPIVEDFIQ